MLSLALIMLSAITACRAATMNVQLNPPNVNVGDTITLTINVLDGTVAKINLPQVDGLNALPEISSSTTFSFEGGTYRSNTTKMYQFIATRGGDYTIPPFDVVLQNGTSLRSQALKVHVAADGGTPPAPASDSGAPPVTTSPGVSSSTAAAISSLLNAIAAKRQPAPAPNAISDDAAVSQPSVPRDPDGGPAKVFILITPQTTSAYVGQMVPLRIDFYIREDVRAQQDSLPTIKGSDFLMNDFAVRGGRVSLISFEGEEYECTTWISAICAPKPGDFPLASERDTYWMKSNGGRALDPFGFSHQTDLAHDNITSNQLMMHILPLPDQGRPENFSGVVGQFQVKFDAQPAVVAMGEPVTLTFSVAGTGNFDYVRCPVLDTDSNWKVYAPRSRLTFDPTDETRTRAAKTFEQLVLPQENGNVPLPAASFTYFDPVARQYVAVSFSLPVVAVTGAMPLRSSTAASTALDSAVAGPAADDFIPNQTELGNVRTSMTPAYQHAWFWMVQASLATLPLLGLLVLLLRQRSFPSPHTSGMAERRRSLRQEEEAMNQALRSNRPLDFFVAARHAVQLQLGARWTIQPEAITLGEIRHRDPALAETLGPLFEQADEIIYSGRANATVDLAHWHGMVRDFLHLQPASP